MRKNRLFTIILFAILFLILFICVGSWLYTSYVERRTHQQQERINNLILAHNMDSEKLKEFNRYICDHSSAEIDVSSSFISDKDKMFDTTGQLVYIAVDISNVDSLQLASDLIDMINRYICSETDLFNKYELIVNMYNANDKSVVYKATDFSDMKNEDADVIGYSVKSLYIYADSLPERQMKTSMIINSFNSVSVLEISGEIIFDEIEFLDNSSICKLILHGNGYDAVQIKKMAELYPNVEIITG